VSESAQKILSLIPYSIKDPFFVLDVNGKILYTNKKGTDLLQTPPTSELITNCFESETKERFNKLLDKLIEESKSLTIDNFELGLVSGKKIKVQLLLNLFEGNSSLFVFCTIIPGSYQVAFTDNIKIQLRDIEYENFIKNTELLKLIKKVESLCPITFIGKEIIHKLADELDEIFWITDDKDNLIVVNDYFAYTIGIKPYQMEGKQVVDFVPGYLKNINLTINTYVKETLNCIILEGIPFKEVENLKDKAIVQLPLFDENYNVRLIIGFSQQKENAYLKSKREDIFKDLLTIIGHFPKPVAFITSQSIIKHASEEFCKLFEKKTGDLDGLNFADILPETLVESVQRFILSSDNKRILPVNRQMEIERNGEPECSVYLTKYQDTEKKPDGFSILIEKIEYAENLQHVIKNRGRMFEFLIQNNPEPIYIYDKENLQFLEVNQAALQLYGYSRDEFLQMDLTDLYNPEDIQTLLGSSSDKEGEGKFSKPLRHKKKDGSSVLVELSKISFKFNDREAHFNIIRDVTHNLELERKNQLFKAAFDNTLDMIFVTDPDGIITYVNNAVINNLGISKIDLENSSITALVNEEDRAVIISSIFQSHLKEAVSLNINLKSSAGDYLETEISATPVFNFEDDVESFVIIGKSVGQPIGEVETKEIVKEVIKEIVVEKPVESEEKETSQLETAFLKGVFHEILTPMNVILGFAQELTEGIENLSPDQKEAVEIINQNRGKLLSTMNSIIEFSEVQKKKDEWNITDLTITKVVEDIDKDIYEITGSKELSFAYGKISSSLQFQTDKQKFDCLLNNLIRLVGRLTKGNKIYFSAYQVDDENFMVMVSDNFSATSSYLADTLKKLFIEKRDPKELGIPKLGVQIVRSLLDMLQVKFVSSTNNNGKVECGFLFPVNFQPTMHEKELKDVDDITQETETKESFTFHEEEEFVEETAVQPEEEIEAQEENIIPENSGISFNEEDLKPVSEEVMEEELKTEEPPPLQVEDQEDKIDFAQSEDLSFEEEEKKQTEVSEEKFDVSNLTCLYIEDQVDSQILFKVQMKGLKDIKYAVSFEEALPLLDTERFDFIVMDINLQGEYNGLDALKIIHKMPGYEEIPIIAVTAYVLPGDKEKFIVTGFNDFIAKPIFREKMVESLEKIFLQKA
jgi:PAS domain S-box-containing protein